MLSDEEIKGAYITSTALKIFFEEEFSKKVAEVQDEKIREALIHLDRLSNARHLQSTAFAELCARLSDIIDENIAEILLPVVEQINENMKYLKDKK